MNPRLVREARLLELDWIKKEQVHDQRSRTEAEEKGIKPHSSDMGGHEQRRQEHTVCEEQDLCA